VWIMGLEFLGRDLKAEFQRLLEDGSAAVCRRPADGQMFLLQPIVARPEASGREAAGVSVAPECWPEEWADG
jgi:hypothetical protein